MTVGVPQGTVGIQSVLGSLLGSQPITEGWFEFHLDIKKEIIAPYWISM